ncbi:hypothetical protein BCR36DRAFT_120311 [Piromyces finnis]|uniref:Uncharacterized protein n=1 Tax=Piromyces finnis TaxID=1754191 RepID=A0A1Y1V293_9FUNG|nr:hypothetical protein BCR36DRAFT_120311 [Piromyces finnis]|eukprot:ORX44999.1 hypothetical protein BCR36DRAFT_120311 [Piromyces finnis]
MLFTGERSLPPSSLKNHFQSQECFSSKLLFFLRLIISWYFMYLYLEYSGQLPFL